jgi:hypothetical protein
MSAPVAESAVDADASTAGAAPSAPGAPSLNPKTGLSTDYLNHFTEAIMILEMVGAQPECADDLRAWRPKTYCEHFATSSFRNRAALIAAYATADPAAVAALERSSETLNTALARTRDVVIAHLGTSTAGSLPKHALSRLRPLVARVAAAINGTTASPADRQDRQAEIDAMFAR